MKKKTPMAGLGAKQKPSNNKDKTIPHCDETRHPGQAWVLNKTHRMNRWANYNDRRGWC